MITGGTPMAPSLRLPIRAALAGVLAANVAIAAQAADKVAVGTGGSASDAPFYIAYDQGFFKDEGLDVDLIVLDSGRSEEHTSELQSLRHLVCRLLLEKKK